MRKFTHASYKTDKSFIFRLENQIMEKMHNEKKKRLEQNVGQPWTSEEDSQLISEYNSNINMTEYIFS